MGSFNKEYLSLMELSYDKMQKYNGLTTLNISTMTMVCDMKIDINLEKLTKNFTRPNYPLCFIKKAKTNKDVTYTKRGKAKKSFYNQTTITVSELTNKSVKVFKNGKLQITGLTSQNDFNNTIKVVKEILVNTPEAVNPEDVTHDLIDSKIEMINSNFNFEKELNLKKLRLIMLENKNIKDASYNPDTYPGINAKYNDTSLFVFGTGNIVITGAKSLQEVRDAYEFVSELVCSNKDTHIRKGIGKKPSKNPINYKNGYPESVYIACK